MVQGGMLLSDPSTDPAKSAEIDAMIESLSPVSGASPPPTGAGATATMASQAARFLLVER